MLFLGLPIHCDIIADSHNTFTLPGDLSICFWNGSWLTQRPNGSCVKQYLPKENIRFRGLEILVQVEHYNTQPFHRAWRSIWPWQKAGEMSSTVGILWGHLLRASFSLHESRQTCRLESFLTTYVTDEHQSIWLVTGRMMPMSSMHWEFGLDFVLDVDWTSSWWVNEVLDIWF